MQTLQTTVTPSTTIQDVPYENIKLQFVAVSYLIETIMLQSISKRKIRFILTLSNEMV